MRALLKRLNILVFVTVILVLPLLAQAKTYVVGIEPAFPPWAAMDEGEYKGIAVDAVRAMAKQQGFDVKFKSLPFPSLIPALAAHKIDILATGLTVSEKRAKKIAFTVPWWTVSLDILVKKDSDKNLVTALCCGARVGAQAGSTDYDWLKNNLIDNGVDISVKTYPEDNVAVNDIKVGRLDSYIVDDTTASKYLEKQGDSIRLAGRILPHPPEVYALGVRKDDKALLKLLNKAEVQLYKSGKWEKIIHKYVPAATVGKVPGPMSDDIPSYRKPVPGLGD